MPEGCDAVFHVAGNTSLWSGGDAQQTRENVDGTRYVVETCLARKARRLVHTSTEGAWGEQTAGFDETAKSNALDVDGELRALEVPRRARGREGRRRAASRRASCARGTSSASTTPRQWARIITPRRTGASCPGCRRARGRGRTPAQVAKAHIAAVDKGRSGERYLLGGVVGDVPGDGDDHRTAHGQEGARRSPCRDG